MRQREKKVFINAGANIILYIINIRCTKCNKLLGKKQESAYVEIKCPRCDELNKNKD
jgi:predicted RNA-binding Zn-ribbon protein involved in translation (DUF1610 family)